MNVNTIIFGGRYRVATYPNGQVATIHDPVRDETITLKDGTLFAAQTAAAIELMFADKEKTHA